MQLVISDAHEGLKAFVGKTSPGPIVRRGSGKVGK
jgi:hypothetical protein